jgi:hypothetical protein
LSGRVETSGFIIDATPLNELEVKELVVIPELLPLVARP